MSRLRRRAGILVLALMVLGVAASAGSALASGGCCGGMPAAHGSGGREAPCHSVAPTSCCEANATAHAPGLPGAPLCAGGGLADCTPALSAVAGAFLRPEPSGPARAALATTVLRL
jgi:hypothetical protein